MAVDWKNGEALIARYIDISQPPADLKKQNIEVYGDDRILLFARDGERSLPSSINLRDRGARKEALRKYRSALIYSLTRVPVEIPIEWQPRPTSPSMEGIILFDAKINEVRAQRVHDRIVKRNPEWTDIGSDVIGDLVHSRLAGAQSEVFKGLDGDNVRNPVISERIGKQVRGFLAPILDEHGLEITSDLRMEWGENEAERQERELAEAKLAQQAAFGDVEKGAAEVLSHPAVQKKLATDKAKLLARERHIRTLTQVDAARQARGKQTTLHEEELKTLQAEADELRKTMEATQELERRAARHAAEMAEELDRLGVKAEEDEIDLRKKVAEAEIRSGAAEGDHRRRLELLAAGVMPEQLVKMDGRDVPISEIINEKLAGKLDGDMDPQASEIEDLISELLRMADDSKKTDTEKSFIWAGLAILYKARGAKGTTMEDALEKSERLWRWNPLALQCRIDFEAKRKPQIWVIYKPQYKEQLETLDNLLDSHFKHSGRHLSENVPEYERLKRLHIKCLKQLSKDEVDGGEWGAKLEEIYG